MLLEGDMVFTHVVLNDEDDNVTSEEIPDGKSLVDFDNDVVERDITEQPFPISSKECFVLSCSRPLLSYSKDYSIENLLSLLDADIGIPYEEGDIRKWLEIIDNLDSSTKRVVVDVLEKRNGAVVDYSPVATQCLSSNTAAYLLGGLEQSKSILYYLIKYITKDAKKITNSLCIIREAIQQIRKHPSTAKDSHTDSRTGKHLLQVLLNKLNGMTETSDTQAAAGLLGMPAQFGTAKTTYVFIKSALAYVEERLNGNCRSWSDQYCETDQIFHKRVVKRKQKQDFREKNNMDTEAETRQSLHNRNDDNNDENNDDGNDDDDDDDDDDGEEDEDQGDDDDEDYVDNFSVSSTESGKMVLAYFGK